MNLLGLTFWMGLTAMCNLTADPVIYTTEEDKKIFEDYAKQISSSSCGSPEELIMETASFFLERPYVGATLEKEPEGLVVNLREFDCSTFVETVYALSKTALKKNISFDVFCKNLQNFRYRNGIIEGYISRLHYTTDWIYENEKKGLVRDITSQLGGEPLPVTLSFMSRHPDSYRQLKGNTCLINKIASIEKNINARSHFYIPKEQLEKCQDKIQEGDMICFVTSIEGLDISHVGIAKRVNGELRFIHASSSHKKVIVEPRSIQAYLLVITKNTGIIVVRPTFF
jgi:cell wall-associated NlpC family hydrolase